MATKCKVLALLVAVVLLLATPAGALAALPAQVTIDGQPVSFDQPPIIQNGRVLVPLRGIFERLGATVSYDAMTRSITATSADGRTISLALGSRAATVAGQAVTLDVPAQSIGGRTLVPLRFIATSLGAQVAWEPMARTVAITRAAPPVAITPPPVEPPIARAAESVVVPRPASIVRSSLTPTIRATFADPVEPATVRLMVDGNDMTSGARITSREVVWIATSPMTLGEHRIQVSGLTPGGSAVKADWGFVLNPNLALDPGIDSIQLGPDRPLTRGETLLVTLQGLPNGTARMDVEGNRGLAMREVAPGIYEGTYTVTARDYVHARIVVHLDMPDGRRASLEADERASLFGNPALP